MGGFDIDDKNADLLLMSVFGGRCLR